MLALLLILIISLVTTGLISRVKSILSGRKGPGLFQPVKNVFVLIRKGIVYSDVSGYVTKLAPPLMLASVLLAALMIPAAGFEPLISFDGDFILFAYLLALARFLMIIAAFDTGSSFEGMGASREALYGMLIEPALFVIFASLVLFTGRFSVSTIFRLPGDLNSTLVYGLIISYVIGNITLIENSRVPVDDPKTHLELTMIHEVMILDTSGINLAMVQITSFLKFAIFGSLVASVIVPWDWSPALRVVSYFIVQVLFGTIIGFSESFRARYRMSRNQQYLLTVTLVSVILFVIIIFSKNIL